MPSLSIREANLPSLLPLSAHTTSVCRRCSQPIFANQQPVETDHPLRNKLFATSSPSPPHKQTTQRPRSSTHAKSRFKAQTARSTRPLSPPSTRSPAPRLLTDRRQAQQLGKPSRLPTGPPTQSKHSPSSTNLAPFSAPRSAARTKPQTPPCSITPRRPTHRKPASPTSRGPAHPQGEDRQRNSTHARNEPSLAKGNTPRFPAPNAKKPEEKPSILPFAAPGHPLAQAIPRGHHRRPPSAPRPCEKAS